MSATRNIVSRWFPVSAGLILCLTGLAKVWSASHHTKIMAVPDPILSVPFGHLMLAVGLVELVLGTVCLLRKWPGPTQLLLACFAVNLVAYRFGLWWIDWHKPCSCLGNVTDILHISPAVADAVMKAILAYLLIGSCTSPYWLRQSRKMTSPAEGPA